MATISLQITSLNAATKTISPANATRALAAFRTIYGKKTDAQGVVTDRTDQELWDFIAATYFARMMEDVKNIDADTARKAVVPIDLT